MQNSFGIFAESLQNPKIWRASKWQNLLRIYVSFCSEAEQLVLPVGKLKQKAKSCSNSDCPTICAEFKVLLMAIDN